eukprot:1161163-Pelagomonas_calceolata.AAC.2
MGRCVVAHHLLKLAGAPAVGLAYLCMISDLGTQIQGTFWRDAAEKYDEQMREGAVAETHEEQVRGGGVRVEEVPSVRMKQTWQRASPLGTWTLGKSVQQYLQPLGSDNST